MKQAFWGYFLITFGIVIIIIMLLIQRITTSSEEDFYLAREILESSMIDAVDYGAFRTTGKIVISEQKLVEVFIRRFAESVTDNKSYQVNFYDIHEYPPKATVRIRTSAGRTNPSNRPDNAVDTFDVSVDTVASGVLETIYSTSEEDKLYKITPKIKSGDKKIKKCNEVYIKNNDKLTSAKVSSLCEFETGYELDKFYINNKEIKDAIVVKNDLKIYVTSKPKKMTVSYSDNCGEKCVDKKVAYGVEINLCACSNIKWTLNGEVVNPSKYKVTKDVTFTPLYTFNVRYVNNNNVDICSSKNFNNNTKGSDIKAGCKKDNIASWLYNGVELKDTTTIKSKSNIILTPIYKQFTITYNNNGGSGCSSTKVTYDNSLGSLCQPKRSGFTFKGWQKSNGTYLSASEKIKDNMTVIAVWESACSASNITACPKYTVCLSGQYQIWSGEGFENGYWGTIYSGQTVYMESSEIGKDKVKVYVTPDVNLKYAGSNNKYGWMSFRALCEA